MKYLLIFLLSFSSLISSDDGICELDTLDTQSAQECIQRVLEKEPENIRCISKLANLHLKQGNLLKGFLLAFEAHKINQEETAKSSLSPILPMALKISKLHKVATTKNDEKAWNEIGDYFNNMGVYKESVYAYENSLKIAPQQEMTLLKLSLGYTKTEQNFKAFEELQKLLELYPDNFYANFYMGKIMRYSIKDIPNSKKYFQLAKKLLEKNKDAIPTQEHSQFLSVIIYELSK